MARRPPGRTYRSIVSPAFAVEDGDAATPSADEAFFFKCLHGFRDAGPVGAGALGQGIRG